MSATNLVFDIECVGADFDSLDEPVREYLLKRAKTDEEREQVPGRTALELGLARVVAIGMYSIERDVSMVLLDAGEPGAQPVRIDGVIVEELAEVDMLRRFWELITAGQRRMVSFFGRGYDGPVLMVRSAQLGVPCGKNLVGYRYSLEHHCDLADALCFQGSTRQFYSLAYWCSAFGIPSPKAEGISGADVARLHREGRRDEIARYVLRDVHRTTDLYRALIPLLSQFNGGPALSDLRERPQLALEV